MTTDDCYVAFKPCGCAVAATVDRADHKKEVARDLARWVRQGFTVERRTVDWVRSHMRSCPHGPVPPAAPAAPA